MPVPAAPKLYPLEPLLELAKRHVIGQEGPYGALARLCSFTGVQVTEAKREGGLTERQADRYAIRLGYHPFEVWGEQWWREEQRALFEQIKREVAA